MVRKPRATRTVSSISWDFLPNYARSLSPSWPTFLFSPFFPFAPREVPWETLLAHRGISQVEHQQVPEQRMARVNESEREKGGEKREGGRESDRIRDGRGRRDSWNFDNVRVEVACFAAATTTFLSQLFRSKKEIRARPAAYSALESLRHCLALKFNDAQQRRLVP